MKIVVDLFRLESQGYNQLRLETIRCSRRHDANHRVGLTVHADLLPNDLAIAAQPFPQAISKNDDTVFARFAFRWKKITSQEERHSHHRVKARSCPLAVDLFRLLRSCQIEAATRPGIDGLKGRVLPLPLEKVARR